MSGRKQHIIPKHIQENFAINEKIYVYKKDKDYPSNITDNYAERDYYSTQSAPKLDNEITDLESILISKTWNRLLNTKTNIEHEIDSEILKVIFHLMLRNKYFINDFIDGLIKMIKKNIKYEKKELDYFLKKYLKKNKINGVKIKNISPLFIQEIEKIKNSLINKFEEQREDFRKKFHELSINNIIKCNSFEKYNKFKYCILEYENDTILSDSILLLKKNNEYSNMMLEADLCILPISKNKILFIYENKTELKQITQEKINEELIKNSSELFVFSHKNEKMIELKKMIGSSNKFIDNYEVENFNPYDGLKELLDILFYKKNNK